MAASELEEELKAYGMKLMNPPSSTDELLKILDKVESLLIMVGQCPSDSMESALQPVMEALIGKELLRRTDESVKVSVVSCITELFRITAPKHPYDDRQMKEILQHTVMALQKLSDVTGSSYYKAVQILEALAKVRACVMLLDLGYHSLVIKIFKLFLGIIRPYHPHNVFNKMEEVMTQLIEDSDELSVELLQPLLDSVKKENQIASPVSSKLGEKVLEACAAIVKPYLAEALKSLSLNPEDCEIVASMCNGRPKGELMVGPSNAKFGDTALHDVTHMEQPTDTCTTNIMKPDNPEDVLPETNTKVVSGNIKLTGSSGQHSSGPDISNVSQGHWGQHKTKESTTNEDVHLGVSVPEGDVPQSEVNQKGSLHLGLTSGEGTKHTVYARRKPGRGSRKNDSASNCDAETKSEFSIKSEDGNTSDDNKEPSPQQIDGMKQKNNKTAIKKHDIEEPGDKATKLSVRDENYLNKCVKSKSRRKCSTGKDEDSKSPHTFKDYGEELVGARIKVWWPLDEAFYEGAVSSFDPVKKKHKVKYVDGDVEKLNLQEERWEMLEGNSSEKDHGTDSQGPAVLPVALMNWGRSTKKKAKRNISTKSDPDISSSKRPRSTAENKGSESVEMSVVEKEET